MARYYGGGGFLDTFGSSFVEGLLGMMALDQRRDATDQEFALKRAQDARAAETHALELQRSRLALDETSALQGDLASIYRAAAPQDATPSPSAAPLDQGIGDITSYSGGRPAASTVGDLINRGVDPAALARAQRLSPAALSPLGLQTPEAAADRARADQAREQVTTLMQLPMPADLNEQGKRLGQITGALWKGGFIKSEDAVRRIEESWRTNPETAMKFFAGVKARLDTMPAQPGLGGSAARLREAIMSALADDPSFFVQNPQLAKDLGFDQMLKGGGTEPRSVTPLPANSPGAIVGGQFVPVPPGATPAGPPERPLAVPPGGGVWDPRTRTVIPGPSRPEARPRDPLEAQAEEFAKSRWPQSPQAQQVFLETMAQGRARAKNTFTQGTPQEIGAFFNGAVKMADQVANPGQPAPPPPPAQTQGFLQSIMDWFWNSNETGQAQPRGRPDAMGQGAPPGAIPNPMGAGAPPALPSGQVGGPALPGTSAPAPPAPMGLRMERTERTLPAGAAMPPPGPNYTAADMQAEAQRLVRAGVPPGRVREVMKAAGW